MHFYDVDASKMLTNQRQMTKVSLRQRSLNYYYYYYFKMNPLEPPGGDK